MKNIVFLKLYFSWFIHQKIIESLEFGYSLIFLEFSSKFNQTFLNEFYHWIIIKKRYNVRKKPLYLISLIHTDAIIIAIIPIVVSFLYEKFLNYFLIAFNKYWLFFVFQVYQKSFGIEKYLTNFWKIKSIKYFLYYFNKFLF